MSSSYSAATKIGGTEKVAWGSIPTDDAFNAAGSVSLKKVCQGNLQGQLGETTLETSRLLSMKTPETDKITVQNIDATSSVEFDAVPGFTIIFDRMNPEPSEVY